MVFKMEDLISSSLTVNYRQSTSFYYFSKMQNQNRIYCWRDSKIRLNALFNHRHYEWRIIAFSASDRFCSTNCIRFKVSDSQISSDHHFRPSKIGALIGRKVIRGRSATRSFPVLSGQAGRHGPRVGRPCPTSHWFYKFWQLDNQSRFWRIRNNSFLWIGESTSILKLAVNRVLSGLTWFNLISILNCTVLCFRMLLLLIDSKNRLISVIY